MYRPSASTFLLIAALLVYSTPRPAAAQSITASPDGTGSVITYNSASQTYIINGGTQIEANLFHSFQQFGLGVEEIATFLASPDVANILARVSSGQASVIDGLLRVSGGSDANLFILNPAGVLLGRNAALDLTGSFSASTARGLAFGDRVFQATGDNDYRTLTGNPTGYVFWGSEGPLLNEADLSVISGASIALSGGTVVNTGSLRSPGGNISVVAHPEAGVIEIAQEGWVLGLSLPLDQLENPDPLGMSPLDLPELLSGEWGGDATTVSTLADDTVVLASGETVNTETGAVTITGAIDVAAVQGGRVQILGETVILNGARVNANGTEGGGTVWIGGDNLGQSGLPKAQTTLVDAATSITADAIEVGHGGQIVIWADGTTQFAGQISAQGGAMAGDGGFVETSGAQRLGIAPTAHVMTQAVDGDWGTWLLDPADLMVGATGTADASSGTNLPISDSAIAASTLVTALNGSNVTLQASNSITVDAAIDAGGNTGSLTLEAPTVSLNQPITLQDTLLGSGVTTVNVGVNGRVQQGVDVAATGATVNLAAGTFQAGQTITIDRALTLRGSEVGTTILDGQENHRVLDATGDLTVQNVTITNGSAVGSGGGIRMANNTALTVLNSTISGNAASNKGGGIYFDDGGTLTLNRSTVSGNVAVGGDGGGISFQNGATLTVNDSTIANNTAGDTAADHGGGIYLRNHGTVSLHNTTVSGNVSNFGDGGGINLNNDGVLTVINSRISGNSAGDNGGGIYFNDRGTLSLTDTTVSNNATLDDGGGVHFDADGTATVHRSTISGNSAGEEGGGMYLYNNAGLVMENSTVSGNSAVTRGGGLYARNNASLALTNATIAFNEALSEGGGIYLRSGSGILNSTIVANNSAGAAAPDLLGTFTASHSLIRSPGSATIVGDNNILNQNPLVQPLADNGGATRTHALSPGSPAINAGAAGAAGTDQRGATATGIRDIGAFEAAPMTTPENNASIPPLTGLNPDTLTGGEEDESGFSIGNSSGHPIQCIAPERAESDLPPELFHESLQCAALEDDYSAIVRSSFQDDSRNRTRLSPQLGRAQPQKGAKTSTKYTD